MKISEMELLVRVAQTGSMTLAAQQLNLTPAAVSAAVQRIEAAVGVRLFERTTRSLHPTDEGQVILAGCEDVVGRWQQTLDDARGSKADIEGVVRLSAPADITNEVLAHVVVEVCAAHPKLRVVLDTSDTIKHLHGDAIDMAIRYGALQDSSLSARRLASAPGMLVAAPSYLDAHGTPTRVEDLADHRCLTLHLGNVPEATWQLHRDGAVETVEIDSAMCGNGFLARRWAVDGEGIAYKSLFDVIDDLEAGRLVRVLPNYDGSAIGIHAVFPSRRFLPARVRALDSAITERFVARAARCDAWLAAQR